MAVFEFNRSVGLVAGIGQLTFERAPGLICARDGRGELVMRIATGPGFGQRLAAAFSDYRKATSHNGDGARPPAFTSSYLGGSDWSR